MHPGGVQITYNGPLEEWNKYSTISVPHDIFSPSITGFRSIRKPVSLRVH